MLEGERIDGLKGEPLCERTRQVAARLDQAVPHGIVWSEAILVESLEGDS